ncbi:hypothetical protein PAPYR_9896 [Paratrimastix pyriformis]|uniref:Uncharacterized protein n=1 Tax=Paratrimastix pyriformis TaxID=342808 RepID=A0ABQ8U8U0_9EUKA|nr:hypothetical protein PAPYR_9896 [Paratrimastix pyriformis]
MEAGHARHYQPSRAVQIYKWEAQRNVMETLEKNHSHCDDSKGVGWGFSQVRVVSKRYQRERALYLVTISKNMGQSEYVPLQPTKFNTPIFRHFLICTRVLNFVFCAC